MAAATYRNYLNETFALANTMVIKHSEILTAMNDDVELRLLPRMAGNPFYARNQPHNPELWKCYKNMFGEYHQLDNQLIRAINIALGYPYPSPTDTYTMDEMLVYVASNTTPVLANFNKALLLDNATLANEYRYGTTYYNDLRLRYPEHEHLILGILNPISPTVAVAAKNGDILYAGGYFKSIYTPAGSTAPKTGFLKREMRGVVDIGYIEDNELNVLEQLEQWIRGFLVRWHNPDYAIAHELYLPCMTGVLMLQIPKLIMNLRLANCLTLNAHSFHVREFLESHGKLAKYIPDLPLEQTLFLYRNVRWIEKHIGLQETFNLLVDRLATPAGIPLAKYYIGHDLTDMLAHPDLIPKVVAEQKVINFRQLGNLRDATIVEDIVVKQIGLAKNNPSTPNDIHDEVVDVNLVGILDKGNRYPTKVIESSMLDFGDRVAFPLVDVLLNMWLFTASTGTYTGTIYIAHPLTGHRFFMTPKNAYILFVYCLNKGYLDSELVNIPTVVARNIPRSSAFAPVGHAVKPTLSALRTFAQSRHVHLDELTYLMGTGADPEYAYNSPDLFYRECVKIQSELMRRYYVTCGRHGMDLQQTNTVTGSEAHMGRAQLSAAMSRLYWTDVECTLSNLTYGEWIVQSGVDLLNMERQDYVQLALEIAKKATGNLVNKNEGVRNLQKAVIGIMQQFSSYAIQYVHDINDSAIRVSDTKPLRVQVIVSAGSGYVRGSMHAHSVLAVGGGGANLVKVSVAGLGYRVSNVVIF